jgi:site-specific recombinase XerD
MPKKTCKQWRSVAARLRWLAPHPNGFKIWLQQRGYAPATVTELIRLLACWAEWIHSRGYDLGTAPAGLAHSGAVFRGSKTARAPQGAGALFLAYLREQGVLPPAERSPLPEETWPLLGAFRRWMRELRGIADSTLDIYQQTLVDLLGTLGDDPTRYTAARLRSFALERAKRYRPGGAQAVAVATRAFLRYLIAIGQCPIGLDHAVPSFAAWQLATTPRFLPAADLDRVIAACDGEDRLRDKAVILLLARLGLRASEVASLSFTQIAWGDGSIAVAGKTRREERLPLTQEVGDAIIAYVERSRPKLASPSVFLTDAAPIRPLTRITVKCIVHRALDRAGVDSVHRGAHVLRHSAATAMLRHGVSLAGVRAVLRHRSPSMTALYAKVDFALLSEIAQPWGGRLPC